MYSRTESQFVGYQDCKLFYQRWIPKKAKGQLIITHGHGEHSECYQRVVQALDEQGWSIYAWDWRGHGRSEGQRGFAQSFSDYCYDFESFINYLQNNRLLDSELPTVMLGHSMGATIQLRSLISHPEWKITAQVLSSPLLSPAIEIPALKTLAGQILQSILPKLTLSTGMQNSFLTRDPAVIREYEHDVLRHSRISSGAWFGALDCMKYILERPEKFTAPLLLQVTDKDEVVSSPTALKFYDHLSCAKTLHVYKGHKHELYNDLEREAVFADLNSFLFSMSEN